MPKPEAYVNDIMADPAILKQFIGHHFTEYNNYVIFRQSYFHLLRGTNLYTIYPVEQWDLFKYSPTFALFMGLFAYLPDVIGLPLWNMLNSIVLFAAIRMLPYATRKQCIILWFIAIELLTSIQNTQSNALMGGLIIAAFCLLQRKKAMWAALLLVLATYIKVYGAVGFCFFLFFPDKLKFIFYGLLWMIAFFLLPLIITPYPALIGQYHNWVQMLAADQGASYGLSVMGWLHTWFGLKGGKNIVIAIGLILFLIALGRFKFYKNHVYQLLMLAFMLIWVIIFNHKAESPTFVIALSGIGIWYFIQPRKLPHTWLMWFAFVFTSLITTDIFPPAVKHNIIYPYTIKVIPSIIIWIVVYYEIFNLRNTEEKQFWVS